MEDAAWQTAALSVGWRESIAALVEKREPAWPGRVTGIVRLLLQLDGG